MATLMPARDHFAPLRPYNELAVHAFDSLYSLDAPYQMSIVRFDDEQSLRYDRLVHTGYYFLSFDHKLRDPWCGWSFGTDRVEFVLADPKVFPDTTHQVQPQHASFIFDRQGALTLAPLHYESPMTIAMGDDSFILTRHAAEETVEGFGYRLLQHRYRIRFGEFEYVLEYTQHLDDDILQRAKDRYFKQQLLQEAPVPHLSVTPTPHDLWKGRWKIGDEVGRGSDQTFDSAHAPSGQTHTSISAHHI